MGEMVFLVRQMFYGHPLPSRDLEDSENDALYPARRRESTARRLTRESEIDSDAPAKIARPWGSVPTVTALIRSGNFVTKVAVKIACIEMNIHRKSKFRLVFNPVTERNQQQAAVWKHHQV